jgi:biopolymer transport protein ExbD
MFMLLLFFMISTTFVQYPTIKLELPTASTAEPSKLESLTLTGLPPIVEVPES